MGRSETPDLEEFLGADGARLQVEHFRAQAPKPLYSVVTVHGFAAHCGLYRHLGAYLAEAGIAVTQFDCRGHGRSEGRRGYVASFSEYAVDLAHVIDRARTLTPDVPLVLMGHSQGALIALDFLFGNAGLAMTNRRPDRLILATPWLDLVMKIPALKRTAASLLARLAPKLALGHGIRGQDVSRNPLVIENFYTDPLVHHVATARWYLEARAAQDRVRAAAAHLTTPTLMLIAGQDRIVSNAAALAFAQAAGRSVEVRLYESLYHEVFLEPERDQVLADLLAWLRTPITWAKDLPQARPTVPSIL